MLKPKMSFGDTAVVHPVRVAECKAIPEEIAGVAALVMLFEAVGREVPLATFQMSTEAVPVSTVMFHELMTQE